MRLLLPAPHQLIALLRGLLFLLAFGIFTPLATAQTPSPPAGISKEQYDALVEAISQAVVVKLKALPAGKVAATPPETIPDGADGSVESEVCAFVGRSSRAVEALPELGRRLMGLPALVVEAGGGRGLLAFVSILLLSILAALGAERLVGSLFGNVQRRLSMRAA